MVHLVSSRPLTSDLYRIETRAAPINTISTIRGAYALLLTITPVSSSAACLAEAPVDKWRTAPAASPVLEWDADGCVGSVASARHIGDVWPRTPET